MKGILADIHSSVKFGNNVSVWSFAVICEGVEIGDDCAIGSGVYVGKNCKIGNGVRIQDKAHITDYAIFEDKVFIGPCVVTMNDRYPKVNNPEYRREPPYFEEGCSVGAGAVILPGVRVGKFSMIGAGAVVTKDVAARTTVIGCPAIEMGEKD
jgi:UDP-2-acetamido-3-amino-2,3-dideoxy-glucuronate N-acetyltransferase